MSFFSTESMNALCKKLGCTGACCQDLEGVLATLGGIHGGGGGGIPEIVAKIIKFALSHHLSPVHLMLRIADALAAQGYLAEAIAFYDEVLSQLSRVNRTSTKLMTRALEGKVSALKGLQRESEAAALRTVNLHLQTLESQARGMGKAGNGG